MYTGVDTAVQILCKYIHTSAHRHSYTKLRQLRRGVKWGSPFREEEDTRTPTRTVWLIGVQYYTVMYKARTKGFSKTPILTVGTHVFKHAHSCTKLAEKVLLTKTPTAPTL